MSGIDVDDLKGRLHIAVYPLEAHFLMRINAEEVF